MWRKGGGFEFSLSTLIVLILAVFLGGLAFGFVTDLAAANSKGMARLDVKRITVAVNTMIDEGDAIVELNLNNKYSSIEMSQHSMFMDGEFMDETITASLPEAYRYPQSVVEETTFICIVKRGTRFLMYDIEDCPEEPNGCVEGLCTVVAAEDHGRDPPVDGFYCKNGVFVSRNFHEHFRTSDAPGCGVEAGNFVDLNRFMCPNQVIEGRRYGCVAKATWRCEQGKEMAIRVEGEEEDHERTFDCSGTVQKARFLADFVSRPGQNTIKAEVRVVGTGLSSEEKEREVRVDPGE